MTTITDDTPATLAQHKVQPGDVVHCAHGETGKISEGKNGRIEIHFSHGGVWPLGASTLYYTVLSRAASAPLPHGHVRLRDGSVFDLTADKMLPFGMLDAETQEAMQAHGGPYQVYREAGWLAWKRPAFAPDIAYRVTPLPPAPKVETIAVNRWMTCEATVVGGATAPEGSIPVRATFTRIDGKPDPTSFKLEAR